MSILAIICIAQAVSSLLSTATLYAAIGDSKWKFVTTAAISDTVKLTVYAAVAVEAVRGNWMGIAAAVIGGAIGNAVAHYIRNRKI